MRHEENGGGGGGNVDRETVVAKLDTVVFSNGDVQAKNGTKEEGGGGKGD